MRSSHRSVPCRCVGSVMQHEGCGQSPAGNLYPIITRRLQASAFIFFHTIAFSSRSSSTPTRKARSGGAVATGARTGSLLFRACTAVSTEDSSRSSSEPGTQERSGVASPFTHGAGTERRRRGATDTPFRWRGFASCEFGCSTTESFREIS